MTSWCGASLTAAVLPASATSTFQDGLRRSSGTCATVSFSLFNCRLAAPAAYSHRPRHILPGDYTQALRGACVLRARTVASERSAAEWSTPPHNLDYVSVAVRATGERGCRPRRRLK